MGLAAVGEGFFLLVFLKGVRKRVRRSRVTRKQAEENSARRKGSAGRGYRAYLFLKEAGFAFLDVDKIVKKYTIFY